MTYLQPFQESSCETQKVGNDYGYSLSSSKKLVPRSSWNFDSTKRMVLYYTSGFRIETMYNYYIVMKSMFLVVKLSSHLTIGYASLTILNRISCSDDNGNPTFNQSQPN
jgi:hypothetical protein